MGDNFIVMDSSAKPNFEEIEHTADWALRVRGRDLAELLRHAAEGMVSLLVGQTSEAESPEVSVEVAIEGVDAESLLVNWLSELAYQAEMERLVFSQVDLAEVSPTFLRARFSGRRVDGLHKHIKAVTYHNLEIVETPDGLEATIVFDV
jgi:SHS2 domain-containing protein